MHVYKRHIIDLVLNSASEWVSLRQAVEWSSFFSCLVEKVFNRPFSCRFDKPACWMPLVLNGGHKISPACMSFKSSSICLRDCLHLCIARIVVISHMLQIDWLTMQRQCADGLYIFRVMPSYWSNDMSVLRSTKYTWRGVEDVLAGEIAERASWMIDRICTS
jgi:hypothetical protein